MNKGYVIKLATQAIKLGELEVSFVPVVKQDEGFVDPVNNYIYPKSMVFETIEHAKMTIENVLEMMNANRDSF